MKCFCYIFLLVAAILFTLIKTHGKKDDNMRQYAPDQQTFTKLSILLEYNVWIKFECKNITDFKEFEKLLANHSAVLRNVADTVKIINCPLPNDGQSINLMLHKLGIYWYRRLLIKNDAFSIRLLTKKQFSYFQFPLQRLTLQLSQLTHMSSEVFADTTLRNLTVLDLYTNLTKLPPEVFQNLENLIYLNIGHNLEILYEGQFHKQTKLQHLNLSKNKLIKLSSSNLFSIKLLQFPKNLIETSATNIFSTLTSLTDVNLNFNRLHYMPSKLFQNNNQLQAFVFTNNQYDIVKLPEKFLANLLKLEKVVVKCGLESLPADIFYNSTNINAIILNSNKLEQIPNKLLETQYKLIHLDLSQNHLKALSSELFQHTIQLKILKLNHNKLKAIQRNLFTTLNNLEYLDLSHNQLNSQDCRIKLDTNIHLKHLYLQNNSISDLYILHGQLPQYLRNLDLSYNQIRKVIGKNLEQLYSDHLVLNLSYNRIQTIQLQDLATHNLLTTLNVLTDLSHNPLKCDCKVLESVDYLKGFNKHLQFNTENLVCWEPSHLRGRYFDKLQKVELLCLLATYKCPQKCECWLRSFDNILIVNCSQQNLTQVPSLPTIKQLGVNGIEMTLSMNQITYLPQAYTEGYANCTKLFLAQNSITSFDKTQVPRNLATLDLQQNHLKFLTAETLAYLNSSHSLKNISLTENTWLCDCSESTLVLYYVTQLNNKKFIDASKMTCHQPAAMYVYEVLDLCNRNKLILNVTVCICVALMCLIVAVYYKYQMNIKIWLYGRNIRLCQCCNEQDSGAEVDIYDAFISYSHKDEDFIINHLIPKLENGCPSYKLCIHGRDFLVGEYIPDQIVNSIADSKRVIVVLSRNFIHSEWAKLEFKEAYRATLIERRQKLIVIMYEDIGDVSNLDKSLKLYLKMNTYLKWGDPQFWEKLRFAMPQKQ